jgi:hypothetical protein
LEVKTIPRQQLYQMSAEQITADLRDGKFSLLESLGCHDLREEMVKAGKSCRKVLWLAEKRAGNSQDAHYSQRLRRAIGSILKKGAPYTIRGTFPHTRCGIVMGFNHPTLGEIIRMVAVCVNEYPRRRYLYPVNIAWYESIATVARRMERFGLYIVPMITPATRAKMDERISEADKEFVNRIAKGFNTQYTYSAVDFIKSGDLVLLAPSATRQSHVFRNYACYQGVEEIQPQTMTYIAMALEKHVDSNYYFLPVAIIPPKTNSRGLNLLKNYTISPTLWLGRKNVDRLCHEKDRVSRHRKFEHYFLDVIADELKDLNADYLIYPQSKGRL